MAEPRDRDRERERERDEAEAPRPRRRVRSEDDEPRAPRRRSAPPRAARRFALDDDEGEDDLVGPRRVTAPRLRRGGRAPTEREKVLGIVRDIPNFARLLAGLARDPRVSAADKALVVAAIGYVFIPSDLIPDWIPGLGELDELVVISLALSRLLNNAGVDVLLDHWHGDPAHLELALSFLERAGSFLPARLRTILGGRR